MKQFHLLIQLLFAPSPYWHTKWCKFQTTTTESWTKVHEHLSGDIVGDMRTGNRYRLTLLCIPSTSTRQGYQAPWLKPGLGYHLPFRAWGLGQDTMRIEVLQ